MKLLLLLLLSATARAEVPVQLSWFEDHEAKLSIGDVLARKDSLPWQVARHQDPSFGQTAGRVWVRFRLPPLAPEARPPLFAEIANAFLGRVTLYTTKGGQVVDSDSAGLAVPVKDRTDDVLRTGFTFFKLDPPFTPETEFYLSVEGRLPLALPLRIFDSHEVPLRHGIVMFVAGLYLGGILLALLMNGTVAIVLRSRLYLYYTLFVVSMAWMGLSSTGLSVQLLWPNSPWWAERDILFAVGFSLIFYVSFIREFLGTKQLTPWLDRLLVACALVSTARSLWVPFSYHQALAVAGDAASAFNNVISFVIAVIAVRRNVPGAKLFLAASALFDLAIVVFIGQDLGWFWIAPSARWGPYYASLFEVLLLSVALADRIRQANRVIVQQRAAMVHADKIAALGRMAGELAHEISNPLAIIHGNAVLIRDQAVLPHIREFATTIESTANRISRMVKGMRSLTRDTRRDPFRSVAFDSILQDAGALCREVARLRGIEIRVPEADPSMLLHCRGEEICQVLVNLMGNALDALQGVNNACIRVEIRREGAEAEISVIDNGPGVPREIRAQILEPFFTTKEPGKGLGLGLSISRTIVEAHGGRLWLADLDGGARFHFTVPCGKVGSV